MTGLRIERWNGALFLFYYVAYTIDLILGAQQHEVLRGYSDVMFRMVVPLTVVMILVPLFFEWKGHRMSRM